MKELLERLSHPQRINRQVGRKPGTPLLVLKFKKDKFLGFERFPDVETAREKIYPNSRYNYIHTRFTEAKRKGKKIVHLSKSPLGEVFILKERDKNEFSSLIMHYEQKIT